MRVPLSLSHAAREVCPGKLHHRSGALLIGSKRLQKEKCRSTVAESIQIGFGPPHTPSKREALGTLLAEEGRPIAIASVVMRHTRRRSP
jgi:hypothetical protein